MIQIEKVLRDFEYVEEVKQRGDLEVTYEEYVEEIKQEEDVKIEYVGVKQEEDEKIENEHDETYDVLADESYEVDVNENQDETYSKKFVEPNPGSKRGHKVFRDSRSKVRKYIISFLYVHFCFKYYLLILYCCSW